MKNLFFILLLLIYTATTTIGMSQTHVNTDANISGHVILSNTGEHLPYIQISVIGTTIGTTTDATGHYFLKNLPEGKYNIRASGIGYAPQSFVVVFEANKTIEVNFSLNEDTMELEQVVVSSSRSEMKRANSSSLVNVLTYKTFDAVGAKSLVDVLDYQPGIRVEDNCQNCGFMQVRINGLDGHYSQILMNSRPIYSALTGVYGLEQIPANVVDRVEVVRGGGSALFGASAIGGTINIITKDPVNNSAEIAHSLTSIGITSALDNNTTLNASVVTDSNKAGIMLYGQNRIRDSYDTDGDGYSEIPMLRTKTIGMRSFIKTGSFGKLNFQYHGINEFRRGGNMLDKIPHEANLAEQTNHSINGGEISYDLFLRNYKDKINIYSSFQHTKRDSYYGGDKDPNAYGNTTDLVVVSGAQYTHKWNRLWFLPSELVCGLEYNYNNLTDEYPGYNQYICQKVNIISGYLQNEWRDEKWGVLLGLRVDKHNLINKPIFSPRVNFRYNPNKSFNFRLTYSSGFRAPQTFDEDLHVAIVGGKRVTTILASDLKQESSQSISFSADMYRTFGRIKTNLLVELFYTDLKDIFATRIVSKDELSGTNVLERYNGSGARVFGANIEAKFGLFPQLQVQGGATIQSSQYKSPEYWSEDKSVPPQTKMFRSPNAYGYIMAIYNPVKQLTAAVTGTFTGTMPVQHLIGSGVNKDIAVMTPIFYDLNIKLAYDFKIYRSITLQLNIAVMNVLNSYQKDFDQGHLRDSGYIYGPSSPRSIAVGLKLSI
ncbi:MAG: TonB-dependent receptor [Bacteroidales bacterium]